MSDRHEFGFYAFISYKREDERWAGWLQRKLETYRIPAVIRRQRQDIPEKVYPVFRDKTDLTGGKVLNQLHRELEDSRFLIVICSPNSARSSWVDKEIRHFIELGREDYIIPFIVDGEPYAEDPERECFPEALRNGVQSEILGISTEELGKRRAFLRVVATLLGLKFDQLVMRDYRRQKNRRMLVTTAAAFAVITLLAVLWYELPHRAYYRDYVYCNEIPQGIDRLSRGRRQELSLCYQLVTKRGKVVSLECQNSGGKVVRPQSVIMRDDPAIINFFYEGNGVSRAECRNEYGRIILIKDYTTNLKAVDFLRSDDSSQAITLSANQSVMDNSLYGIDFFDVTARSGITRHLNTFDERGYLIRELYMRDNLNTPARDSNGIYGKQYDRNQNGQITKIVFLDASGNPKVSRCGVAGWTYSYDDAGRVIKTSAFDAEGKPVREEKGYTSMRIKYNGEGNIESLDYLDEAGEICSIKEGYAKVRWEYDEAFAVGQYFYGRNGEPVFDKAQGVHAIKQTYDKKKNISSVSGYDTGMELLTNNYGYTKIISWYDEQGRVTQNQFLDQADRGAFDNDSGTSGIRYEYDKNSNLVSIAYLDGHGELLMSKYGYALIECWYDEAGRMLGQKFMDEKGQPVFITENYSVVEYSYDKRGNLSTFFYQDENGAPCMTAYGYAKKVDEYDERGNVISTSYYDEFGNAVIARDGFHMVRMEYDEQGNCVLMAYFDAEGRPIRIPDGYAVAKTTYDSYGNVTEYAYYNTDGEPASVTGGAERMEFVYDERGNRVRITKKSRLGAFAKPYSYASCLYEYDGMDNLIAEHYLDLHGKPCNNEEGIASYKYTFDDQNRLVLTQMFDESGNPSMALGYSAGQSEYNQKNQLTANTYYGESGGTVTSNILLVERRFYDTRGYCTEASYEDQNGLPDNTRGYCRIRWSYDSGGNITQEAYYDEQGKPCRTADNNYASVSSKYDQRGNQVEIQYYDEAGVPVLIRQGYSRMESEYGPQGWKLSDTFYDTEGKLIGGEDGLACKIEYTYDKCGREKDFILYDNEGRKIYRLQYLVVVDEVVEGKQAEKAGLMSGDVLVCYNSWEQFNYDYFLDAQDALQQVIFSEENKEKLIIVSRLTEDGASEFKEFRMGAGFLGVSLQYLPCTQAELETLGSEYEKWRETA